MLCEVENHVDYIIVYLPTSNNLLQKIHNELGSDHECSQVIHFCQNGWPSQACVGYDLQPYFQVCNNILFQRGLLLKCNRIVNPMILQKEILNKIHEGHQGITKCHARAKSVWWPDLSRDIESFVNCCNVCVLNIALILLSRCCNPFYLIACGKK